MKKINSSKYLFALFLIALFGSVNTAQTGGQFAITQSVVANGGESSTGGSFGITGTNAQPSAGTDSTGGQFRVNGGFWQAFLAPTAAQVSVGGRVLAAKGNGIRNARVSLTNPAGETQTAVTGSFGYFYFEEVLVGETYIITVWSRRFQFSNPTQVLFVTDEVNDLVFIADR